LQFSLQVASPETFGCALVNVLLASQQQKCKQHGQCERNALAVLEMQLLQIK
jgi:hypothetical protein